MKHEIYSKNPWEQRKLGEVAIFYNGRAYKQEELLSIGKYPVLRVGNFYTNDDWYYSNLELPSYQYAEEGDLLYTWSASFGPHIWEGSKVIYHYHIWKIELHDCADKFFILQLLENDKNQLISDKNGSTMVHITKNGIENKNVFLPSKIQEQTQIGSFFQKLDSLITLHERKLELLKKKKQAYLQQIFSQKLRFKGFTGPWEQRKLGEVADELIAGGDIDENMLCTNGIYPVIGNALTNKGIVGYYNNYYRVQAPAITVTGRGEIGHAEVREDNFTPVVRLLSLKTSHDLNYLANYINRLQVLNESTGVPQLTAPQFAKYQIIIPTQQKEEHDIGRFFSCINSLITLHEHKISLLKQKKQAYLQQIFV